MMLSRMPWLLLCALLLAGPALGQGDSEAGWKRERAAIAQRLAAEEAACYQKFAVNECLLSARQKARSEQADIQQRENADKARQRRENSARHQQELQDKRDAAAAQVPKRDALTAPTQSARQRTSQPAPQVRSAAAEKGLAERAAQQRARDAQAVQAHQRLLEKQRAAAEREQGRMRRQAERDAKGRPAVTQLPDPD